MFKLLYTEKKLRSEGLITKSGHRLQHIARIIVESAAIYALNNLLYAVLYVFKTNYEAEPSAFVSFFFFSKIFCLGWLLVGF